MPWQVADPINDVAHLVEVRRAAQVPHKVKAHAAYTALLQFRKIVIDPKASPAQMIRRAGVVRTARLILKGYVYIQSSVWCGA